MGLRTGTPDAEATITTRSARLDPGTSRVVGRRSSGAPPAHVQRHRRQARASAIDSPSRAPASHCAQQCRIQAASPSAVPAANPAAASRYAAPAAQVPDLRHGQALRVQPRGDRGQPGRRAGHHAVRRCGTGDSASSSPCTTATSTGAGHRGAAGDQLGQQVQPRRRRRGPAGAGRAPRRSTRSVGREHVQPGQRLQRRALPDRRAAGPIASAMRTAPASTGSVDLAVGRDLGGRRRPAPPTPGPPAPPPRPRSPASRGGSPGGRAPRPRASRAACHRVGDAGQLQQRRQRVGHVHRTLPA